MRGECFEMKEKQMIPIKEVYDEINKSISLGFERAIRIAFDRSLSDKIDHLKFTVNCLLEEDIFSWLKIKYPDIYEEWILHLKNRLNQRKLCNQQEKAK